MNHVTARITFHSSIFEGIPLLITFTILHMFWESFYGFGFSLATAIFIRIVLYFFEKDIECIGRKLRNFWDARIIKRK